MFKIDIHLCLKPVLIMSSEAAKPTKQISGQLVADNWAVYTLEQHKFFGHCLKTKRNHTENSKVWV